MCPPRELGGYIVYKMLYRANLDTEKGSINLHTTCLAQVMQGLCILTLSDPTCIHGHRTWHGPAMPLS